MAQIENITDLHERATWEKIHSQLEDMNKRSDFIRSLDILEKAALIVNDHRQILYCNTAFLNMAGVSSADQVFALRPGEVMHCKNSAYAPLGCGSSPACAFCNIFKIIEETLSGINAVGKEHIIQCIKHDENQMLRLHVSGTPLKIDHFPAALLIFKPYKSIVPHPNLSEGV